MKKYIIIWADYDGWNTAYIYGRYNTEAEAIKALKKSYRDDKKDLYDCDTKYKDDWSYQIRNDDRTISVKIEVIEF